MTSTSPTDRPGPLPPPPQGCRVVRAKGKLQRYALAAIIAPGRRDAGEAVQGFLEYARLRRLDLTNLWAVADEADRVRAAALAVPSPGRVAMLFASRETGPSRQEHVARAIDAATSNLPGIDLAQAILEVEDASAAAAFEAAGFARLAILSYEKLRLPTRPREPAPAWPDGIEAFSYADLPTADADRLFCQALDASYEDTRDCPELRGIRRTADVLVGHRATGEFDPQLWTLLTRAGKPEGALLLALLPEKGTHELVYIGLSPLLRGHGVARLLLCWGISQLVARRGRALTLAVDEANEPARKLYRSLGFLSTDRRLALIRNIRLKS